MTAAGAGDPAVETARPDTPAEAVPPHVAFDPEADLSDNAGCLTALALALDLAVRDAIRR